MILGLTWLESDTEKRFKLTVVKGNGIVVNINANDLDELLGQVSADASHSGKERQILLDDLSDRIWEKLDNYFPIKEY